MKIIKLGNVTVRGILWNFILILFEVHFFQNLMYIDVLAESISTSEELPKESSGKCFVAGAVFRKSNKWPRLQKEGEGNIKTNPMLHFPRNCVSS